MRRVICLSLCIALALSLTACSGRQASDISLYDLNKAVSNAADFKEMKYVSSQDESPEELFRHISDIDYSKVDGFFINYAVNGTGNADEVACIMLKSKADVSLATESLNAHLQKRIGLYTSYDKSQLDKLSNAVIASHGNVVILMVGDNSAKMERAFHAFFED